MRGLLPAGILAACLLAAAPLSARPRAVFPAPLSLLEAMTRGRSGAGEPLAAAARQRAAVARARQAAGHQLPRIRLSEQWLRTDSPADAFGLLLNQQRFSFQEFVAGDPNAPEPLETAITRLEVELPIWTGGELTARVRQAKLVAEAAAADAGRAADSAAVVAAEAWVRLAQARETVALYERSRETVAAHVDLARNYAAQGMIVRSDQLLAEVELARIDDLLAEARGEARIAEANLGHRLGEPIDTEYALGALDVPPALARTQEEWVAASGGRYDLAGARDLLAAGELEAKALAGGLFPRVGLVGRYDLTDDRPFGSHGTSTSLVALASFDLFDGGTRRAAIAAARADAEAARVDVDRLAQGIQLEAQQAYEVASVALDRRATAAAALDAAAEAARIVEQRFRAGVVRSTDLLDAVDARHSAELRELVARTDAWLARLRLALAVGERPEAILAVGERPEAILAVGERPESILAVGESARSATPEPLLGSRGRTP